MDSSTIEKNKVKQRIIKYLINNKGRKRVEPLQINSNQKYLLKNNSSLIEEFKLKSEEEKTYFKNILEELNKDCIVNYHDNTIEMFSNKTALLAGFLKKDKLGNYYVPVDDRKYYIDKEYMDGAIIGDYVIISPVLEEAKGDKKADIKRVVYRNELGCMIIYKMIDGELKLVPYNFEIDLPIDYSYIDTSKLVEGSIVLVDIDERMTNCAYKANYRSVIGHIDDPDMEDKMIALMNGIKLEFSDEAIKEAENINNCVTEKDMVGRVDLRDETIFTIDGSHTKDMDDAVSLKINEKGNYVLSVHIAAVDYYIRPGMRLFSEAIERGTSSYLIDSVIPMFPHKLSNGICSLNPNVDRLTRTVEMEIKPDGEIIDGKIFDSVINSKKKMTYEDVNQIIDGDVQLEGYETFYSDLLLMKKLSDEMNKSKIRRGYINFGNSDEVVMLDDDGNPISFNSRKIGSAEKIIENFMVLANEFVATEYVDKPFVYRVHEAPDTEQLEDGCDKLREIEEAISSSKDPLHLRNANLENPTIFLQKTLKYAQNSDLDYALISYILLRKMKKANYTTENIGHFGLALENYTHFTSPIRRASDLLVHTLISAYQKGPNDIKYKKIISNLETYCIHISKKERDADKAERESIRCKKEKFIENNIGNTFKGTIIYLDNQCACIRLENGIEGKFIYGEKVFFDRGSLSFYINNSLYKIGEKINVTIERNIGESKAYSFVPVLKEQEKQQNKQLVLSMN